MITLCMDTSHRYLTLAMIENDKVIGSFQKECFKRQSETILEELDALCKKLGIRNDQIDSVCITKGPGSYTGVRIAMTIAKVFCTQRNLPLYTLSTLRLFSCGNPDCRVLLDARGKRAYTAVYKNHELIGTESVISLDSLSDIDLNNNIIMGDSFLVHKEEEEQDYALSFLVNKPYWELQDNPHTCVPEYLKDSNAYLVKS